MGRALVAAALVTAVVATAAGLAQAAQRPQAPPISGLTLDGKKLSLATFRGRPVLLNVWSSW